MARRLSNRPILCAVLDAAALGARPEGFARELFASGVDWIQLRDRSLSGESMFRIARALVTARDESRSASHAPDSVATTAKLFSNRRVLVNRRVDIALATKADGAHLGFDALGEIDARRLLPEDVLLGSSLHRLEEIEARAGPAGPSYAHLAPIWDPISKKASRPALGLDLLAKACGKGLPILAQGGIDEKRAAEVIRAGAAGIAVTGILSGARNPMAVAKQLRQALDGALDRVSSPEG